MESMLTLSYMKLSRRDFAEAQLTLAAYLGLVGQLQHVRLVLLAEPSMVEEESANEYAGAN